MSLISVLIALAVEHFYKQIGELRQFGWFARYHDKVFNKLEGQPFRDGPLGVVLILGAVVLAVWLVNAMLAGVAIVFSFIFTVVVLIYCLGPRDLEKDVQNFTQAVERGDIEAAEIMAGEFLDTPPGDKNAADLIKHVEAGILIHANARVLGVLLWCMLLGPVGAALFRLSCQLKSRLAADDSAYANAARDLYRILMWLPARLSVVGFALTGSFVDTMSNWSNVSDMWRRDSDDFIVISGLGAIRHELDVEQRESETDLVCIHHVMALVKRTLLVWVAILAILTLTGLVF